MIRVRQVKVPVSASGEAGVDSSVLFPVCAKKLRVPEERVSSVTIVRHSIDARKKPALFHVYTLDAEVKFPVQVGGRTVASEEALVKALKNKDVEVVEDTVYSFPFSKASVPEEERPVIVGFGPAGLFAAYELALAGFRPIVLERGADVETRMKDVETFWKTGTLQADSNVCFGEGGAGTFSDGKLSSGIKDASGRIREVLQTFVRHGAPEEILYETLPHIGTDRLRDTIRQMRQTILLSGGEVRFHTKVTKILVKDGAVAGVEAADTFVIPSSQVILAIGHSARDTFRMLYDLQVPMEQKGFAVGLRIAHPQALIDDAQYGEGHPLRLPPASYKLTHQTAEERGVYSFCMCPGGYIVNASSEDGALCVNGMSDYARDSKAANSAIVVQVRPEDCAAYLQEVSLAEELNQPEENTSRVRKDFSTKKSNDVESADTIYPLLGVQFQEALERRAYQIGQGVIPVERYEDFKEAVSGDLHEVDSSVFSDDNAMYVDVTSDEGQSFEESERVVIPFLKGGYRFAPVHDILPEAFNRCIIEGIEAFGRKLQGFDAPDALLAGVESRTSSPVRIVRDERLQSPDVQGLYPCGEGAGYAGGIMSAAVDGIKVAEQVAEELSGKQNTK